MIWDKAWPSTWCFTLLCCYTHSRSQMSYSEQKKKTHEEIFKKHILTFHFINFVFAAKGVFRWWAVYNLKRIVLRSNGNIIHTFMPVQIWNNRSYPSFAVCSCKMAVHRPYIHKSVFILRMNVISTNIYEPLLGVLNITAGSLLLYH